MTTKRENGIKEILNSKPFSVLLVMFISVVAGTVSVAVTQKIDETYLRKDVFNEWVKRQEERDALLLRRQEELMKELHDMSITLKSLETSLRYIQEEKRKEEQ